MEEGEGGAEEATPSCLHKFCRQRLTRPQRRHQRLGLGLGLHPQEEGTAAEVVQQEVVQQEVVQQEKAHTDFTNVWLQGAVSLEGS